MSLVGWQVLASYPPAPLLSDGGRQILRWFVRVQPGGGIEDLSYWHGSQQHLY